MKRYISGCVLVGLAACGEDTPVCDSLPHDQLARTPRADRLVERLALRCTDDLAADQARYDVLLADLGAITTVRGERPRDYFGSVELGIAIGATPERIAALVSGENADFSCLNRELGAELVGDEDDLYLEFPSAVYGSSALAALYRRAVADDGEVFEDGVVGDGDRIAFDLRSTPHRYLVSIGSGDCPSGCIDWTRELWHVDEAGARLHATWDDAADAPSDYRRADFECP